LRPITIIGIALGLAMDAFAVSIASGAAIRELRLRHALRIALFFGVFQAAMPVAGWATGIGLRDLIGGIDHWIAFGLLAAVGIKMIYESARMGPGKKRMDPLNPSILLILSIATSIDALAVGISFAFLRIAIVTPVLVIGMVTFLLSLSGVYLGDRAGHLFEKKIALLGGILLIIIGIKILIEHLVA
jgi:putative Mn2+ efflux pump MntP